MEKQKKTEYRLIYRMIFGLLLFGLMEKNLFEEEPIFSKELFPVTSVPASADDSWEEAETTPYGRYPETVSYTLGKMTNESYSGLPEGDTYEENAYTKYIEEKLNIRTELILKADETSYSAVENLALANGEMPDIMVVDDRELLRTMVENGMLEDLSPYFDNCFSSRTREFYDSYGEDFFSAVTFDGAVYGIPGTDIYSGANFIWLRKDWMEKLGLSEPQTLEDVERIILQFIEKDPGENGKGRTIGLLCDKTLTADTSACFNVAPVFDAFGAYPGIWIPRADGNGVVYGTVQPETKTALEKLRDWYEKGILDRGFLLRTVRNDGDLLMEGRSGAFFGWWWAPNSPLEEAMRKAPSAEWQPYLLSNQSDGSVTTSIPYADEKYVVVKKGYEHPEIVMKILSLLFDYARYEDPEASEIQNYFKIGVEPAATPFVINCDYSDAILRVTEHLEQVLSEELESSALNTLERGYFDACKSWLEREDQDFLSSDWAAYTSRITAVDEMMERKVNYINADYTQVFAGLIPAGMLAEEHDMMIRIIMGETPLSEFDVFVERWYELGGQEAQSEADQLLRKITSERN